MVYSLALRERIVATVREGVNQLEVAECFRVSLSSVERYVRLARQGELRAKPPPGRPASISTEAYEALAEQVAQHNDASLKEHGELWQQEQGTSVSVYAMCRTLKRAELTRKKDASGERARPSAKSRMATSGWKARPKQAGVYR